MLKLKKSILKPNTKFLIKFLNINKSSQLNKGNYLKIKNIILIKQKLVIILEK